MPPADLDIYGDGLTTQVFPLNEVPWELVADQTLREVISGAGAAAIVAAAAALVVPERCHARYARLHVALLASQVLGLDQPAPLPIIV